MDWAGLALSYPDYQRLRRDPEQRAGSFDPTTTWSTAAVAALLHALIWELDMAWSGVEVVDADIESPEAFVVLYRAIYMDGPLAIRGEKDLGGAYVAGAQTAEEFGGQFALYLEEPSGSESFVQPDENGLRWFVDFRDDEQS
jgi:hypothetical protein